MTKIKVKIGYTVHLMTVGFDEASRAHCSEGEFKQPIGHGGTIELEVDVLDRVFGMLDKDHFLQIVLVGELDCITDDATDDVKLVAYKRVDDD